MDFHRVLAVLEGVPAPTPVDFDVTARYTGEGLGPDEASVTVRVMLRPFDKSLTDPEIEAHRTALVRALEEQLGVRLRS
jgi:phenylalanyl-tRNA synthetase beta subunit